MINLVQSCVFVGYLCGLFDVRLRVRAAQDGRMWRQGPRRSVRGDGHGGGRGAVRLRRGEERWV